MSLDTHITRLARFVERRLGPLHRPLVWLSQLAVFAAAGLMAFLLRFEFSIPATHQKHLLWALPVWIVVKSLAFRLAMLDRGWWRYVSVTDVVRIGLANLGASLVSAAVLMTAGPPGFPRSIYLLDLFLCFLGTAGLRVTVRLFAETASRGVKRVTRNAVIYGAGSAGIMLLDELRRNPGLPYRVAGFVDDDPEKSGMVVHGVRVLGRGEDLCKVAKTRGAEVVLIAMPSATGAEMTRILRLCQGAGVEYKTIPGFADLIEEHGLARQIRDVAVEDLLGRNPVRLDETVIRGKLAGKVVLVTGAAGSIGSELCRQVARFGAAAVVAFEIAESPLFELEREMRRSCPGLDFRPEIGSIQNTARVREVLARHKPAVIYHAAAYKHVPMMEAHVFEAIENNVFGTYNLAVAAADARVDDFVMISSDKAVRPANVMGATKRLAEAVVESLQDGGTRFVSVRFGNVLGSAGSVVPIFKKQIAAGGPVTVTHPEMRRFFMTIPEAVQLVLQASALGRGGEVFVLDMGEPVRIRDLAENLILLSGLKPGEDIRIEYTGVRPGEKLYEELSTLLEDTLATPHEKIRVLAGNGLMAGSVAGCLATLRQACEARDLARAVLAMKDALPEYNPSAELLRRMVPLRGKAAAGRAAGGV